jgi:hypothetical protein
MIGRGARQLVLGALFGQEHEPTHQVFRPVVFGERAVRPVGRLPVFAMLES